MPGGERRRWSSRRRPTARRPGRRPRPGTRRSALERAQLGGAVGAPRSAVKQHDPELARELAGNGDGLPAGNVEGQLGERVARVQQGHGLPPYGCRRVNPSAQLAADRGRGLTPSLPRRAGQLGALFRWRPRQQPQRRTSGSRTPFFGAPDVSSRPAGAPHSVDLQQNQVPPAGRRSRSAAPGYGIFDTYRHWTTLTIRRTSTAQHPGRPGQGELGRAAVASHGQTSAARRRPGVRLTDRRVTSERIRPPRPAWTMAKLDREVCAVIKANQRTVRRREPWPVSDEDS